MTVGERIRTLRKQNGWITNRNSGFGEDISHELHS